MSPTSLATFLSGKSGLSYKRACSIASSLKWTPARLEHFWDLIQARCSPQTKRRLEASRRVRLRLNQFNQRLSTTAFGLISDWQNLAILTFLQMHPEGTTAGHISSRFAFERAVSVRCLARLRRLGLAHRKDGRWLATKANSHTEAEERCEATIEFHRQILDLACRDLEDVERWEPDKSLSVVYSVDRERMPKLRRELREAILRVLSDNAQASERETEVQALTLQLFSLMPTRRDVRKS